MTTDSPIQRTLKIGNSTVGLIGLDQAIIRALADQKPAQEAVEFIYAMINQNNYIPAGSEETYKKALLAEYQRHQQNITDTDTDKITIRILGPGCVSCNKIYTMSIDFLQKHNIVADIESIHELDEIWRYGETKTPVLIINEEVKSSGRMPSPSEIEGWIKEAADL